MFNKLESSSPVAVMRALIWGGLIFFVISGMFTGKMATAGGVTIIDNITEWKHPVKDVLNRHKVVVYKVELHNKSYPIFYVRFPYDPWLAHNDKFFKPLYHETLKANGFWDYAFIDRESNCRINIKWDKRSRTLTESLEDFH